MADIDKQPPARPFFRGLSWLVAVVCFLCALVAVSGFMDEDDRFFMTYLFCLIGSLFTSIALTGYGALRQPSMRKEQGGINLILAILCLLFLALGMDAAGKPGMWHRCIAWLQIVAGLIGAIANLVVFQRLRRKHK